MPSTTSLQTNPVLISSLARILEIEDGEFGNRCKVSVTSIDGGSNFSSVYKVEVLQENGGGAKEEWRWFMKVVEGEGMVRGEFYSLKAIHLTVPRLCPLPYCYGSLSPTTTTHLTFYDDSPTMPPLPPPSPSLEPLDHDPTTSTTLFFLLTDYISTLPSSPPTTLHPHQRLSYKLALLHSTPAPSGGVPGFPVTTMCGSTPQPNHPVPGNRSWAGFFAERRLKAIGERCPKLRTMSRREEGRDVRGLVERVCTEVVPRLLEVGGGGEEEELVVCHGDLWSGNYTKGRIERVWGGIGRRRRETDEERQEKGESGSSEEKMSKVNRETITGEFIFDPSAVYAPPTYDHGIMHIFGGFGGSFWSEYWRYRKEFHFTKSRPFASPTKPIPWDIKDQPTPTDSRIKMYELYHYLNHYALFGWAYGLGAEKIMKELLGKGRDGGEAWVGEV